MPLDNTLRLRLKDIARDAIRRGFGTHAPPVLDLTHEPVELRQPRATFVTLELDGRLRGCIGSLEPRRPLAEDVHQNAFAAAFHDNRFAPLREDEFPDLAIHISILQPPEPIEARSEEELIRLLRPHRDGLILQCHERRATFLPAVWEDLPEPAAFIRHLKLKAGLPASGWDPAIRCWRYETESF